MFKKKSLCLSLSLFSLPLAAHAHDVDGVECVRRREAP